MKKPITYADSGVDIDRADRAKQRIKYLAHRTFTKGVVSEIGGFGGMFAVDKKKFREPVMVSSVDGVGTKLKLAFMMNIHHTVGGDLVNHCVNDIAVQGATPLFFMDYLATGTLEPEIAEKVVEGIAEACRHNGCALIGGETAEMPGFYPRGEYDLAGFIVGMADKSKIITGKNVAAGDVLVGLPSNGLHTNGYSLARKLFFEIAQGGPDIYFGTLNATIGDVLLRPHASYLRALEGVLDGGLIKGLAHITGGGLTENIPRILPEGTGIEIQLGSWPVLRVFEVMQQIGNVEEAEMFRTFNMGVGMVIVGAEREAAKIKTHVESLGEACYQIGRVTSGDQKVSYVR